MEQFKTDPLSILAKQFPELQLPKGRLTPIPGVVVGRVNFGRLAPVIHEGYGRLRFAG